MLTNIILTSIYVLALQDNKYFISKLSKEKGDMLDSFISKTNTTDLHSVFGNGAYWLELYPIIKIDKIIEDEKDDYDNLVKYYMASFGAHNVRGGSFTDVVFQQDKFYQLVKELNIEYVRDNLEGFQYESEIIKEQKEYINEDNYQHLNFQQDYDDGYRNVDYNNYDE